MNTRFHTFLTRGLTVAAAALALTVGASSQALARDQDGYRDHDRSHRYSQRIERNYGRQAHHGYRDWHRARHYRKPRHHDAPYAPYGLGFITGYLLGQHD